MKDEELDKLRKQRESVNIEFKSMIDDPQKIAKTVVAFANTSGGHILIGINDDRSVKGVSELPEIEKVNEVLAIVESVGTVIHHVFYQEKKKIIILEVNESIDKPVDLFGDIFYRFDDKTMLAGKEMLQTLTKYEAIPNLAIDQIKKNLRSHLRLKFGITAKQFGQMMNYSEQRAEKLLYEYLREGFLMITEIQKPFIFSLRQK